jgi:hypothetical protein
VEELLRLNIAKQHGRTGCGSKQEGFPSEFLWHRLFSSFFRLVQDLSYALFPRHGPLLHSKEVAASWHRANQDT